MSGLEVCQSNARRKALFSVVNAICYEAGFSTVEKAVSETLTEMLQSCLFEIGRSTQAFCELTGRTEPLFGDVLMALVEMGISVDSLAAYAKRVNRVVLPTPTITAQPSIPRILQAGEKKPLPNYIPEHYPPFPDPHAYTRTPTHKQPVTEYEAIREKAASQKRDVERALTRFIAKTGAANCLFLDDANLYPLIACKPVPNPYLTSLLPKDQIFDEESDDKNQISKGSKQGVQHLEDSVGPKADASSDLEVMDNPYLRPVKMPKKRKR